MNGISSSLKDELKKTTDSKLKVKIRFIGAIIISNILVASLCLSLQEEKKIETTALVRAHHPHYQMMILPLNLLISKEDQEKKETLITLISSEKKIVVARAYLHEEVKANSSLDPLSEGPQKRFKIEIPESELIKVSDYVEKGVIAVPYIETKTVKSIHRGSKYEVTF